MQFFLNIGQEDFNISDVFPLDPDEVFACWLLFCITQKETLLECSFSADGIKIESSRVRISH